MNRFNVIALKTVIDEAFGDYKDCHMLLVAASCTWKCEGCQNRHLVQLSTKDYDADQLALRFFRNPLSKAVVIGGLEPMDKMKDLVSFVNAMERTSWEFPGEKPPIVIYTGYTEDVLEEYLYWSGLDPAMRTYGKCIIKYGPYVPDSIPTYNDILGVTLASSNQYARKFGW